MRENKECLECGGLYFRAETVTDTQWEARKYCSSACAGKAATRRNKEKKEEAAENPPVFITRDPEAEQPAVIEHQPVMRELKIVRVGPNPRMVVCEYFELAQRRTCTVMVKRTAKFVRGMRLTMPEPKSEEDYRRPWVYEGKAPRWRGRW